MAVPEPLLNAVHFCYFSIEMNEILTFGVDFHADSCEIYRFLKFAKWEKLRRYFCKLCAISVNCPNFHGSDLCLTEFSISRTNFVSNFVPLLTEKKFIPTFGAKNIFSIRWPEGSGGRKKWIAIRKLTWLSRNLC